LGRTPHKLKPSKLLSPLVQQFKNVKTRSSDSSRSSVRARSCTTHLPSTTSGPVQTQQPCSLKGSLSSDNIYAGLQGDVTGAFGQPTQPPGSATPSSHQPVMGLAQAQANNSNNKTGVLPEDLHRLMEDWAQEILIVTQRPRSNSLSISRQELWDQVVPQTHRRLTGDSEVCPPSAVTAAAFRALSSPLSVTQGHRFLPSLPVQHLAFPTQDAASYQPGNRKTRTL
uniref:Uncharacterized protein n=1 Tax=Takifugu rubripes TaxID=31033 RepID=A0A3B5K4S1_TAKRU